MDRRICNKKRRPFKVLFIFGNRKKVTHGAVSGEYGGAIVTVLFLGENSRFGINFVQFWKNYRPLTDITNIIGRTVRGLAKRTYGEYRAAACDRDTRSKAQFGRQIERRTRTFRLLRKRETA